MKKIIALLLILCVGVTVLAQNAEPADSRVPLTKRGYKILPEEGDFAIGIEATPFFQYLGNMFNKNDNPAPFVDGYKGSIYGKYFFRDDMAIRVRFNLDIYSKDYKGVVPNDTELYFNPMNTDATVIDIKTSNHQAFQLAAGWEYRRGYRRLQGFAGGEIGGGFGRSHIKYVYGNPISELNQVPSTTDFDENVFYDPYFKRVLNTKPGISWNVGLNGFVGAEYFIAPKLSIGGEVGLGLFVGNTSQGTQITECWDGNQPFEQTNRYYDPDASSTVVRVGTNFYGGIFLMFHF